MPCIATVGRMEQLRRRWRNALKTRGRLFLASIMALVLLSSGCAAHEPSDAPAEVIDAARAQSLISAWEEQVDGAAELGWTPCPDAPEFDCGRLEVPLNWSDPVGDTTRIAVRKLSPASDNAPVLLILPGGPGQSGTELLTDLFDAGAHPEVAEQYTLISLDPRGVTGLQAADLPLDCPTQAQECAPSEALSRFASTTDVALDIEHLRGAVNADQIRILGYSYGTYTGALYGTLFTDHVAYAVFDGAAVAIGFSPLGYERQAIAFEDALDRFLGACVVGELGSCPFTGDVAEAKAQLLQLRALLAQQPLLEDSGDTDGVIDGDTVTQHLLATFYGPRSGWAGTAGWLLEVQSASAEAQLRDTGQAGESDREEQGESHDADELSVPARLSHAVICAMPDAASSQDPEAGVEPLDGDDFFFVPDSATSADIDAAAHACASGLPAHLDTRIRAEDGRKYLVTSVLGDPATPYTDAATLADALGAFLLPVEGEGHTSVLGQSPCATQISMAFLANGELPAAGTTCAGSAS
ncbi:alpha/beta hydrolase [Leucobacter ruminantium]